MIVFVSNNISVISWWPVLLVEETGGPRVLNQPICVKKGKIYAGYGIRNTSRMHMNVFKYFECELKRTKCENNKIF